jgi:riboflavin synthase
MFTGIVETVGTVAAVRRERGGATIPIRAALPSGPFAVGESIAVSGPCLTVERVVPGGFECFASAETLARTTLSRLASGSRVNLERALAVGGRLGGHLVSGHVDGVGRLRRASASGSARELWFDAPGDLGPFLAPKGSVAIDGVSLTVNRVSLPEFSVMIVPHTLSATTLADLAPGAEVNLEADVVARYVASILAARGGGLTGEKLRALGWLDEEER